MYNVLISAKQQGFDVFNALNVLDNKEFIEDLKFGRGDGLLRYYIYNWKSTPMQTNEVGLVLM